ncbi:MAG: hydantoinase/oxoprolinase family protein [Desulfobacteraceae bacterium]|jgi:N-methylhydantoinase A/oxoprolinase/acetone carboxylase beta subunit|nr:hydantoinase/oxoprolinase family protein [Desulfobacteraceae bacterium]
MIIGLDVGGTHTDVVLLDNQGLRKEVKVPTDPADLFGSVLSGLTAIIEDIDPTAIDRIVLSTTLTTNAVIQDKTPPVGMIVSSGPGIDPEFYRTNSHYFSVAGSINHRGREAEPIDVDEIQQIVVDLKKEGIRYVGVVGKFSIRNPSHELQINGILNNSFEKVFMGHRISGNLNFGRRIATAFLNASVYPLHKKFYNAVQQSLEASGLKLPLRILKADGGNMNFKTSIECPAQTILSGPAASVMGATAFGSEEEDTLVMDIGGTTTDLAVLIKGAPVLDPLGIELGNYKTLLRSLETLSIGLGGDSAVKIVDGKLTIGPERLGPAMAYGGPGPTPTDALCILGDIPDGSRARAAAGLEPLAAQLGFSVKALAAEVIDVSCKKIFSAARQLIYRINSKPVYTVHEFLDGYIVQPQTIYVLGGPAPYFARYLETTSDYRIRVVPKWKVANAIGAALARTTCQVTFFADTQRRVAQAPEENFSQKIDHRFDAEAAVHMACELLKAKAVKRGANPDHLEMEVLEALEFNMVRGFNTTGKNIRVKVQVKPGLIPGYDEMIRGLSES